MGEHAIQRIAERYGDIWTEKWNNKRGEIWHLGLDMLKVIMK